ncbi:hypothetical protein KI387_041283, partial [Taxus chinensis]
GKRRGCEQEEEVKGMDGTHFPSGNDNSPLAGLFMTADNKEPKGEELDLGKSYEDLSNTHEQGMKVVHPCKQFPSHACIKTKVTLGSGTEIGLIRDNLLSKAICIL